jgi:hypothetical protein
MSSGPAVSASTTIATVADVTSPTESSQESVHSLYDAQLVKAEPAAQPARVISVREDLEAKDTDAAIKDDEEALKDTELEALPKTHPKALYICRISGCNLGFRTHFGLIRHSEVGCERADAWVSLVFSPA